MPWSDLAADKTADVDVLAICATGQLLELHVRTHYSLQAQVQSECMHDAKPSLHINNAIVRMCQHILNIHIIYTLCMYTIHTY